MFRTNVINLITEKNFSYNNKMSMVIIDNIRKNMLEPTQMAGWPKSLQIKTTSNYTNANYQKNIIETNFIQSGNDLKHFLLQKKMLVCIVSEWKWLCIPFLIKEGLIT